MVRTRALFVSLVLLSLASPAAAGIFGRGKPKSDPAMRVPELLIQLKTDKDEAKRTAAAEELRQYDPKAYPEIMATLIDALSKDMSPAVRSEVATSIGKLRPISQQAGYALEQATANDGSMRVRMSARQALWQYHLVGYRSGKPTEMSAPPAAPVVAAAPAPSAPAGTTRVTQRVAAGQFRETPEPPLAEPLPAPATTAPASPPPQPRGPANPSKSSNPPRPIAPPPPPPVTRKLVTPPPPPVVPSPPQKSEAAATPPKSDGPELPF